MKEMTLNCGGNLIDISQPKVMGILNLTPNSFYDGGKYTQETAVLKRAEEILEQGAQFIDLGAYSSKPNAELVSEEEETKRLLPAIELILRKFPKTLLSIDTFRSGVAKKAVENGAIIINDISAGFLDKKMLETVVSLQVPYVMMHSKGNPQTMQNLAQYGDIVKEMMLYFSERVYKARSLGLNDIIIDPGFGFAKTLEHNYEVLQKLNYFTHLNVPILVGISRKSMIYKLLETTPKNALNGTTILNTIALQKGAKILRVHDVKEAVECVKIIEALTA